MSLGLVCTFANFSDKVRVATLAALVIWGFGFIAPASAQTTSHDDLGCGHALSGPVLARWNAMGGVKGPLGCPLSDETGTASSPRGSSARQAIFTGGAIVWHGSGPRTGQTYAVIGCAWRLWFQYGAASGWLGLPLEDVRNTPDGQSQAFEGGAIVATRARDDCEAETGAPAQTANAGTTPSGIAALSPLDQFHDPARNDWFAAASAPAIARAVAAGYRRVRNEGYVMTAPAPGAEPLKAYWSESQGTHDTVATAEGEREALAAGYAYEGAQGWVWADPRPGTRPLKRFRNVATGHSLVTARPEGEAQALASGYAFTRIEGYVMAGP